MISLPSSDLLKKRPVKPKLSASLLIVDRSELVPRFLFGKRHERHRFMPGAHVFPGGKLDRVDCLHSEAEMTDRQLLETSLGPRKTRVSATALGYCAVRETFEETGYVFGSTETQFSTSNGEYQLSNLRFLARAVTPPQYPLRYETYFFMVFRDFATLEGNLTSADSELADLIWANSEEAKTLNLPTITRMILDEAVVRLNGDPTLADAAPVPSFYTRNGRHYRSHISL